METFKNDMLSLQKEKDGTTNSFGGGFSGTKGNSQI